MSISKHTSMPLTKGESGANTVLNQAASGMHEGVDKLASAADNAARQVTPSIERAAKASHHAVDKVAGLAAPAAIWLDKQGNSLIANQRALVADTGQYVAGHPWRVIGITLAAGFLIGRILRW